jgi:hypothetical protein
VRTLGKVGATAVMTGALLVSTAGIAAAKPKEVSPGKYAKTLCGTLGGISKSETDLAGQLGDIDQTDPVAYQTQASDLASRYQEEWVKAAKKLKQRYPDIDDGKKVAKRFVAYLNEGADTIQDAIDKFRAADPNGVAFNADVTVFGVAFQTLSAKLGDPFSEVDDQDLLQAFKDQKSCEGIVTIF